MVKALKIKKEKPMELQDVFMEFHKKISVAFRKEAQNIPLTIPQLETLRFIVDEKQVTMNDLAKHLNITAPSATTMIENLHKKKLVDRRSSPSDRRTVCIFPTSKASEFFSSFARLKIRVFDKILAVLSTEDKKKLTVILKKLI